MSSAVIRISSYRGKVCPIPKKEDRKDKEGMETGQSFREQLKCSIDPRGKRRGISHIYDDNPLPEVILNDGRHLKTLNESCDMSFLDEER